MKCKWSLGMRVKEKLNSGWQRSKEEEGRPKLEGNESLWIYKVEECLLSFATEDDTVKNGDRRDQRIEIHHRISLKKKFRCIFSPIQNACCTKDTLNEIASQKTLHNNKLFKSIWI